MQDMVSHPVYTVTMVTPMDMMKLYITHSP